jgi:hypothetical protein
MKRTTLTGMKALIAMRAAQVGSDRAVRAAAEDGGSVVGHTAMGILTHLRDDLREAGKFAEDAVKAIRLAPDYDPGVYGRTDDEIADHIVALVKQREESRRA